VPEAADSWVWLARIRRPQGRKGEVFAEILTDFPEKFAERKQIWLLSPKKLRPLLGDPDCLRRTRLPKSGSAAARPAAQAPRQVELQTIGCTRAASCCTSRKWIRSQRLSCWRN